MKGHGVGRGRQRRPTGREKFSTVNLYPQMEIPEGIPYPRVLFCLAWASPAAARVEIIRKSLRSPNCAAVQQAGLETGQQPMFSSVNMVGSVQMKSCVPFSGSKCSPAFLISRICNYLVSQCLLYPPAPRHPGTPRSLSDLAPKIIPGRYKQKLHR